MDGSKLVKLLLLAAILFAAWKYGLPWIKQQTSHAAEASATGSAASSCIVDAERASSSWGSGIGRFANPPYDVEAWSRFRADIDSKIATAETSCSDSSESSQKARSAMRDLRSLVADLDSAIRSGAPPAGDIVQRQEAIDAQLDAARELVRSGK
ncbi:MAG TPA: hypothetical protein VG323_14060 [Thermoanaerobaculia bacterium]|nr:hypothetical protein [Thermoanaerobaculia bacterium]